MAYKNIIVVRKPGTIITQGYIERAVKNASYMGVAVVHEGKLVIEHRKGSPKIEEIRKIQDGLMDNHIVFNFTDKPEILDTDMLPFRVVLDKDKGDEIAVFMDGNFEGYAVPKSSHTDEFHAFDDFIGKKLQKIYRISNAGLPGLYAELQDKLTQQEFQNSWTSRGSMAFLTTAGEAITIMNKGNVFAQEFPWGWTSHSLNYTEKASTPPAPPEMSLLEKLKLKAAGKAEAPPPAAPAPVDPPKTDVVLPKDDDKFEEISLPPEAKDWTNKQKINWWVGEVGYKPEGYKMLSTKVKRTKGTKVGILAPLASTNTVEPTSEPVKPVESPVEPGKDVTPQHVIPAVNGDVMPIISPKQKLLLKTNWMKDAEVSRLIGDDLKTLAYDPKKLQEFEEQYQTLADGLGLNPERLWLSFEALMKLGQTDVKALAIYAFNCQNDHKKKMLELQSVYSNPNNKIARAAM